MTQDCEINETKKLIKVLIKQMDQSNLYGYRIYSRISQSAYKSKGHFSVHILSKIGNPHISRMGF